MDIGRRYVVVFHTDWVDRTLAVFFDERHSLVFCVFPRVLLATAGLGELHSVEPQRSSGYFSLLKEFFV